MKNFIELNEATFGNKILVDVKRIVFIEECKNSRFIKLSGANDYVKYGGVYVSDSYDEIIQMINKLVVI